MQPRSVRDLLVALGALAAAGPTGLLLLGPHLPRLAGLTSYAGTFLPWSILLLPVLAVAGLAWRSPVLGVGTVALVVALGVTVLPAVGRGDRDFAPVLTLASENVGAGNPDPATTIRSLAAGEPDLIALEELTGPSEAAARQLLDARYPHHLIDGTVGVWSTRPLTDAAPLDLDGETGRGLVVDVATAPEPVRVYVVHLASYRLGRYRERDAQLDQLATAVAQDPASRVLLVGDFNAASTDPAFRHLTGVAPEHGLPLLGLGFTWPSRLPLVRLDHVLERGLPQVRTQVLSGNGSDHRGISAMVAEG
jgi:vancomycin resistance protein VanJ